LAFQQEIVDYIMGVIWIFSLWPCEIWLLINFSSFCGSECFVFYWH